MTVRAREIDAFLGVPVICYLDRLDERIREALVEVIDPAADEDTGTAVDPGRNPEAVDRVTVDSRQPEDVTASTPSRPALTRPAVDLSRSIGPAEWRRMLEAADRDNDCFLPN